MRKTDNNDSMDNYKVVLITGRKRRKAMSGWNIERNRSNNAVEAEKKGLLKRSECDMSHLLHVFKEEMIDLYDLKEKYGGGIDDIYFYLQDISDGILRKRANIARYFSFSEWHHINCGGFVKEIDYYSFDAERFYLDEVRKNYTAEVKAECARTRKQKEEESKKRAEEQKREKDLKEQKRLYFIGMIVDNSSKLRFWQSKKGVRFFDWKGASTTNEPFTESRTELQKRLADGWMYDLDVVKAICKAYGFARQTKPKKKAEKDKGIDL